MEKKMALIFNAVAVIEGDKELTPKFYKKVGDILKANFDGRYRLFVLAGTNRSCIVEYMKQKYYLYYDWDKEEYICEKN